MGRFGLSLLQFALPLFLFIGSAHANGVNGPITSAQPVTGTVTGTGSDSYTFNVSLGKSFLVSIAETGVHDPNFVPQVEIDGPGGIHWITPQPLYEVMAKADPADGQWTIKVSRLDTKNVSGGGYRLTLVQAPAGQAATVLSAGAAQSRANTRGNPDIWTFNGVANQKKKLSLKPAGGQDFVPEAYLFTPSGKLYGSGPCSGECTIPAGEAGNYTVVVVRGDYADATGTYSISFSEQN